MPDNSNYFSVFNIIRPDEIPKSFIYILKKISQQRIYVETINRHAMNETFHESNSTCHGEKKCFTWCKLRLDLMQIRSFRSSLENMYSKMC